MLTVSSVPQLPAGQEFATAVVPCPAGLEGTAHAECRGSGPGGSLAWQLANVTCVQITCPPTVVSFEPPAEWAQFKFQDQVRVDAVAQEQLLGNSLLGQRLGAETPKVGDIVSCRPGDCGRSQFQAELRSAGAEVTAGPSQRQNLKNRARSIGASSEVMHRLCYRAAPAHDSVLDGRRSEEVPTECEWFPTAGLFIIRRKPVGSVLFPRALPGYGALTRQCAAPQLAGTLTMTCAPGATAWSYNWTGTARSNASTSTSACGSVLGSTDGVPGRHTGSGQPDNSDRVLWGRCDHIALTAAPAPPGLWRSDANVCAWNHCADASAEVGVAAVAGPCADGSCKAKLDFPTASVGEFVAVSCQPAINEDTGFRFAAVVGMVEAVCGRSGEWLPRAAGWAQTGEDNYQPGHHYFSGCFATGDLRVIANTVWQGAAEQKPPRPGSCTPSVDFGDPASTAPKVGHASLPLNVNKLLAMDGTVFRPSIEWAGKNRPIVGPSSIQSGRAAPMLGLLTAARATCRQAFGPASHAYLATTCRALLLSQQWLPNATAVRQLCGERPDTVVGPETRSPDEDGVWLSWNPTADMNSPSPEGTCEQVFPWIDAAGPGGDCGPGAGFGACFPEQLALSMGNTLYEVTVALAEGPALTGSKERARQKSLLPGLYKRLSADPADAALAEAWAAHWGLSSDWKPPSGWWTRPSSGESWLTAAIPVDSPWCSCKLTRARPAEAFSSMNSAHHAIGASQVPHSCNPLRRAPAAAVS